MAQRYFEGVAHANLYAKFRPSPPQNLGNEIIGYLKKKYTGDLNLCLDVGCGNGQSSNIFSPYFQKVIATDASPAQVEVANSMNHPTNITFVVGVAEQLPVKDGSAQIVTASQACHWFDLASFFKETKRVLCPGGIVALSGYTFPKFLHPTKADDLEKAFDLLYHKRTGSFWGKGRELVDNEYSDIALPFKDFTREEFWTDPITTTMSEFVGYITTWSGFQNYCKVHGLKAGEEILEEFTSSCLKAFENYEENAQLLITRKYFLLMGRV
ncbi:putative methyltransferase DDB_G0268948 [Daphnia carinata]|uniref:putative methyltransferase DDB_G0268948 n=1 Tax=Daphnia carinata TaxID=120202 RepID=UPI00257AF08E|nr:putative methyltransferase DDB_G0268948 [Daphnia carinata]